MTAHSRRELVKTQIRPLSFASHRRHLPSFHEGENITMLAANKQYTDLQEIRLRGFICQFRFNSSCPSPEAYSIAYSRDDPSVSWKL
jgi:hypothetical protein